MARDRSVRGLVLLPSAGDTASGAGSGRPPVDGVRDPDPRASGCGGKHHRGGRGLLVVVREGAEVTHPIYSQRCTRAQYCAIVLQPRTWRCAAGVIGITLLSAPHPRTAAAVQQGWAHLGKRQVDFRADHDIVRTAGEGRTISWRSEEHTSELQSPCNLVCRLLLEKK